MESKKWRIGQIWAARTWKSLSQIYNWAENGEPYVKKFQTLCFTFLFFVFVLDPSAAPVLSLGSYVSNHEQCINDMDYRRVSVLWKVPHQLALLIYQMVEKSHLYHIPWYIMQLITICSCLGKFRSHDTNFLKELHCYWPYYKLVLIGE